MKLIFTFSIFLAVIVMSGQTDSFSNFEISDEQKIRNDSLLSAWGDKTKPDSLRQGAYLNYIWDLKIHDKDSSLILAINLLKWAKERDYKFGVSDAYNLIGNIHIDLSNYQKAIYYHNLSLELDKKIKNYEGQALSYDTLGEVYGILGDYNESLKYYKNELEISESHKIEFSREMSISNIANTYNLLGEPKKAIKYYNKGLNLIRNNYKKNKNYRYSLESNTLLDIGRTYMATGNLKEALESYLKALKISELVNEYQSSSSLKEISALYIKLEDYKSALKYNEMVLRIEESSGFIDMGYLLPLAVIKIDIAKNLASLGEYPKAFDNIEQAIKIIKESEDIYLLSEVMLTAGNISLKANDINKALMNYSSALNIAKNIKVRPLEAKAYKNLGIIYDRLNESENAEKAFNNSLLILEEVDDKRLLSETYLHYGLYELKAHKNKHAITLFEIGNSHANIINDNKLQIDFCTSLYKAYKALGNGTKALEYHEKMLVLNDSLKSEETAKKLQQMEFSKQVLADSLLQVEKDLQVEMAHQTEVRKKDKNRNLALGAGIFFLVLSGGFYSRWRYVKKSKIIIEKEKDRSESLLLNILPSEIAEELKEKGSADARDFDMVSILFTDFKGFTQASEKLTAKELIGEINHCFKAFDLICEKYGIEKIKTIGDAYMAAGGLPAPSDTAVKNTVLAALEMQAFISERIISKEANNEQPFKMRLGIHSGPVVAGIVGIKKFQYDIWGDTVNTASRMESSGKIGKVNISEDTYKLLKDEPQFKFEARGKVQAKGKGEIKMFFVSKTA